jgi:anti-sigma factor RsiW
MSFPSDKTTLSPAERAELSALADGTIDPDRRAAVQARIAQSPQLTALYERERHVVEALHRTNAATRAPAHLRARIDAQRPSARVRVRRRVGYAGGLAGALAAVVLALVLILPGGSPGAPSVSQAAALATLGPTHAAPAPNPAAPRVKLGGGVGDVYFPNWERSFHTRAVGQRKDGLGGRPAVTVYYRWHGRLLAYTIVGLPALSQPAARVTHRNGIDLRTLKLHGRLVVTWRRAGHTCILSGVGVSPAQLHELAAWTAPGIS